MTDAFDPKWHETEEEDLQAIEQAALDDSVARLRASDEDEHMQHRLNLVDQLLKHAPLVKPSAEFAERVMEAIRRQSTEPFNQYTALGLAMGFSAIVMFSLAILVGLFSLIGLILLNWTAIYQALILAIGTLSQTLLHWINQMESDSPLMTIITIVAIPLLGVWWWVMQRFSASGATD